MKINTILNQRLRQIDSELNKNPIIQRDYEMNQELLIIKEIAGRLCNKPFDFDDNNMPVIKQFIKYFNGDVSSTNNGYSLRKGLMISGTKGAGKTLLLEIFKKYCHIKRLKHQFRIEFSDDMTDRYANSGYDGINLYMHNKHQIAVGVEPSKPISLCIDDLGVEKTTVKFYGSEEDVIAKILFVRYRLFKQGYLTHASTNLDAGMLKSRYGERLYSRFKEMFNYIYLPGDDRRQ